MNTERGEWWRGLRDIAAIVTAAAGVLIGAHGLIDIMAVLLGTLRFHLAMPAELAVGFAVPLVLLPRDYRLRTVALTIGLAGIGGLVRTGMNISHSIETGRPLPHSSLQYVLLFSFYGLFVMTFFVWYFWDKSRQGRRPRTAKRQREDR